MMQDPSSSLRKYSATSKKRTSHSKKQRKDRESQS